MLDLARVMDVYEGSDGEATKALFECLEPLGPAGRVAINLFRAQKSSARAKVYRGRRFRGSAYDRKEWAIGNLCAALVEHGDHLAIGWGWSEDETQPVYRQVLYVDLPTGQVSFHAGHRGVGPDYEHRWDGRRGASPARICRWIVQLLSEKE